MAGFGFFAGGLADSMQKGMAQNSLDNYRMGELKLQQQAQQNAEKRQQFAQIDKIRTDHMGVITDTIEQMKIAGKSEAEISKAIQPLIQPLKKLDQSSGRDPSALDAQIAVELAKPSKTATTAALATAGAKPSTEKVMDASGAQSIVFADPRNKTVTPAAPGPTQTADAAAPPSLTSVVDDDQARAIAEYRQPPFTGTAARSRQAQQVMRNVYRINPDYDATKWTTKQATNKITATADVKADATALNKMVVQQAAIESFENTAIKNGDILVNLAEKVDSTGRPVIERWLRAGKQSIAGDPDVAEFNTQMTLYRAEVAKILTNPNMTGVLTDSARREVAEGLDSGASAEQIRRVHNLLKGDFQRRNEALTEGITKLRTRLKGEKPKEEEKPKDEPKIPPPPPGAILSSPGR